MGKRGPYADKPWADALRLVMHEEDLSDPEGRKNLRMVAEACVTAAKAGDMQAVKEIGDRLDGKAKQSVEVEHSITDLYLRLLENLERTEHGPDSAVEAQPERLRH